MFKTNISMAVASTDDKIPIGGAMRVYITDKEYHDVPISVITADRETAIKQATALINFLFDQLESSQ